MLPIYGAIYSACFLFAYYLRFDFRLPAGRVRFCHSSHRAA